MISFKLFLENQRRLQERRTIPLDLSNPIEKNFESRLDKDYDFADNIIRWYKNSKREGMSSSELNSIYKTNLDNLIDLLNEYANCVKKIRSAGKKQLKVNVKTRHGTKPYGINDINEFNFLDVAQNFIKAVCDEAAKLSTVSTGKAKYQITNEDAKKIYLLDFSAHVALWVTEGPDRDTTNKLVYQLWNNVEKADSKMDKGDVYGDPDDFSPYCTHSELHWRGYSKKAYKEDPKNYKQFWYFKKIPGANYVKGDLTNKSVQKIFEKMSGTGADTIICMNDSINEMLDKFDRKVEDISKLEFGNEIKDLQNKNFTEIAINPGYIFKNETYIFSKLAKEFLFLKDQVPDELLNMNKDNMLAEVVEGSIYIDNEDSFKNFLKYSKNLKTVTGNFRLESCFTLESLKGCPNEVGGIFNCSYCDSLKSLKGAPRKVGGDFGCYNCDSLKSLEGAPEKVGRDFNCSSCNSLKSLEGAPEKVGGDFNCSRCNSLKSLEGAPKKVKGEFKCNGCHSLESLEGAPEKVGGDFDCSYCLSLEYLKGVPKEVKGNFYCSGCDSLRSLENSPKVVDGNFICDRNKHLNNLKGMSDIKIGKSIDCSSCTYLKSLEGAPKIVNGDFDCSSCTYLKTLENGPEIVKGDFDCSYCENLENLHGSPKHVEGGFDCKSCWRIKSLEGSPEYVGGDFDCSEDDYLKSFDGKPKHIGGKFIEPEKEDSYY